ncbi:uncharacterized protein BO95DRAFT_497235 [Aspergillus brunneoviolaceus CBS 621.78]|uniref:Uncharacterized protein n=1 Tax=Aspergillus brunneoviolaceus CBS 621.78 TaxID=1450534 RepID=A0ACD1G7R8_9EURO|nr:hypothetical protein BO95DRAFT_497235 [Aspergillus brunneoviolaceus CBS 621.78]RAH45329.1 hypothetical protein BO95DRAFT_497235 [Aspergillus brunneoviolaceus CBS 621.78]
MASGFALRTAQPVTGGGIANKISSAPQWNTHPTRSLAGGLDGATGECNPTEWYQPLTATKLRTKNKHFAARPPANPSACPRGATDSICTFTSGTGGQPVQIAYSRETVAHTRCRHPRK